VRLPDSNFLGVGDHEVNRDERSRAEPPELAEPLVRDEVVGQHWHRIDALEGIVDERRLDSASPNRLLILLTREMSEPSHRREGSRAVAFD
jgi:hypothetical protein